MKEWLRQPPEQVPSGLDPNSSTSHQLRNALRKRGWQIQESASEVRLVMPGTAEGDAQIEAVLGEAGAEEAGDVEATSFGLEAQLRDFVARNLGRIPVNGHRVALFTDAEGRTGVEYTTGVGPIDILGVDEAGGLVVFELKIERGPDRTLGQLARYMGWVTQHLAQGRAVRGVIVARAIDDKLRYAATIIPNVLLLEYELEFKLRDVKLPGATTG